MLAFQQAFYSSWIITLRLGFGLSEEARVAYLRERIDEAKRSERNWGIMATIVLIFAIGSYFLEVGLELVIVQVIVFVVAVVMELLSTRNRIRLMEELRKMALVEPCPKCGKQIPEGNFAFCPFCGANLTSKQE